MEIITKNIKLLGGIFIISIVLFGTLAVPVVIYQNKFFPHTTILQSDIGNLSVAEATTKITNDYPHPESISLLGPDKTYTILTSDIDFSYKYSETINHAFTSQKPSQLTSIPTIFRNFSYPLELSVNKLLLNEYLSVIADEITTEPIYPSLSLAGTRVTVKRGEIGTDLNISSLQNEILERLQQGNQETLPINITTINPTISDSEAERFQKRGEALLSSTISIDSDDESFEYSKQDLLDLLAPHDSYNESKIHTIIEEISTSINREPVNPVFVYENNKVTEFSPAKDGLTVDTDTLVEDITKSLALLEKDPETPQVITISLTRVKPSITTEEVNNLGIKERIGKGTSQFKGSIASRIHNIGLGASKFNGILIKPGEVFSFNQTIGDISALTGYEQSYVIQDGKTILGDGGGVCQVSTTLFRAALNAGLPIVERRSHSYRVTYYEQGTPPGLDATVYSPTTDFKIKNDTPNYILIQTAFDPVNATLEFELYGTDDGRVVELTKPVITSQSPPPEDYYQDDPTLPTGTIKQIDWAAWGAKVQFDYSVTRNGETLQDETFYSNYRPWQAKFLRGTGPTL